MDASLRVVNRSRTPASVNDRQNGWFCSLFSPSIKVLGDRGFIETLGVKYFSLQ
jgi:hypothetical protein